MKKLLLIAIVATANLMAQAAPTILLGSLVTVNGTSNSQVVALSPQQLGFQVLNFQNGGMTSTNACTLNIQIASGNSDGTTNSFQTIGVYTFPTTNAQSVSYYQPSTNVVFYLRVQAVTTNAVALGGSYGN
jgi:hypothetical protein